MGTKRTKTIHDPVFVHVLPWFTIELPTNAMSGRPQTQRGVRIGPCEVPTPLCQQGQKRHQSGAQRLSFEIFVGVRGGAPITLEVTKQIAIKQNQTKSNSYNHDHFDTLQLDRSLDAILPCFQATWTCDSQTTTQIPMHTYLHSYIYI